MLSSASLPGIPGGMSLVILWFTFFRESAVKFLLRHGVECREKFFTNSLTSHQIFYILLCAFEPPRGTSKPFSQSPNTNSKDPLSNEYLCPLTLPWRTASGSVYLLAWRAKLTSPLFFVFVFVFVFCLYRAKYVAYGGSQVRDLIRTVAVCLHHSHSNTRSKPCLQPTPQLMAMLDP